MVIMGFHSTMLILKDWALQIMNLFIRMGVRPSPRGHVSWACEVNGTLRESISQVGKLIFELSASETIAPLNTEQRKIQQLLQFRDITYQTTASAENKLQQVVEVRERCHVPGEVAQPIQI